MLRHRESLIQAAAAHVRRVQKTLDQMNPQWHHVITDLTGLTGLAGPRYGWMNVDVCDAFERPCSERAFQGHLNEPRIDRRDNLTVGL